MLLNCLHCTSKDGIKQVISALSIAQNLQGCKQNREATQLIRLRLTSVVDILQ